MNPVSLAEDTLLGSVLAGETVEETLLAILMVLVMEVAFKTVAVRRGFPFEALALDAVVW